MLVLEREVRPPAAKNTILGSRSKLSEAYTMIPGFQLIMRPILELIEDGQPRPFAECVSTLAGRLRLTGEERGKGQKGTDHLSLLRLHATKAERQPGDDLTGSHLRRPHC
jgi:hypothetical protein